MDYDGEPSRFLEYDVDTSYSCALLLSHAFSFPSLHGLWGHHSFDTDSSVLIGSYDDDFSMVVAQSSESKMQSGSNTEEWQLKQGKHGTKLVSNFGE